MTQKKEKTKIVTPTLRCSFPSLFFHSEISEKYEITLLIPKKEKAFLKKLNAAVLFVAEEKWGKDKAKKILQNNKGTDYQAVKDGDNTERDELQEHYYIKAKAGVKDKEGMKKPVVIDQKKQEIFEPSEVYGGCYVRASMNLYCYEFQQKKGVSFGLIAVQKIKDGESFGGGYNDEDFETVETDVDNEEDNEEEIEEVF